MVQERTMGSPATPLVDPLAVHATKDHLFVLDWGDRTVKKLNHDGNLLQTYRALSERGAKESLAPTHFAVNPAGEIWICYQQDQLIKVFSGSGKVLHTFKVQRLPHRVYPSPDGGFLVMGGDPSPDLFQKYNRHGNLTGSFGRIVAGEVQHPLVLDGWIAGSEKLIYASRYGGILAAYSPKGDLIYLVQTVDPSPLPNIWVNGSKRWRVEPGSPLKSLSLSVSDGKVYVLSERESKVARYRIIDVYQESNGFYAYSIRLPTTARHATMSGNTLYTVGDGSVVRWRIADQITRFEAKQAVR